VLRLFIFNLTDNQRNPFKVPVLLTEIMIHAQMAKRWTYILIFFYTKKIWGVGGDEGETNAPCPMPITLNLFTAR
jgi:hypothetical protein